MQAKNLHAPSLFSCRSFIQPANDRGISTGIERLTEIQVLKASHSIEALWPLSRGEMPFARNEMGQNDGQHH
jgi:hypothetical protein